MRSFYLLFAALFAALFSFPAFAACTSPAGAESQTRYDFAAHEMLYCDGTDWVGSASRGSLPVCSQGETLIMGATGWICGNAGACSGGGVNISDACWYLGAGGDSCATICASRGGYDAKTRDFAGSGGTNTNCQLILDALGAGAGGATIANYTGQATGCSLYSNALGMKSRYRHTDPTTDAAAASGYGRVCACNN